MSELKTVDIKGVEILKVGTFVGAAGGKQTYTREDLQEFAAAHAALVEGGHYPTVYLGHNNPPGSELPEPPAVGRIVALSVKGDKLLADLTDVPGEVAALMQVKAYGTRSIEGVRLSWGRAIEIAGKRYRQVLTGLALLGKNLPAVGGLADVVKLYGAGPVADDWTDVPLQLAAAAADPIEEALAGLDAWSALAMELIKGKTYAPAIRQRVRMLRDDFRRIAGGSTRVEAQMDLRKTLKLADDASDADVLAGLVKLAGASDPATAMAVIAEILGVPDADPAALVAKVRELAGGGAAPDPAAADGGTAMSGGNVKNAAGEGDALAQLQSEVAKLRADQATLLKQTAGLIGDRTRETASAAVDNAIKAGKFVPAQRDTLVKLALLDLPAFEAMAGAQPVTVALGLKGSDGPADTAAFEPSAEEVAVSMSMGMSREAAVALHRAEKAAAAGVTLPAKKED